jgi:hypothetical protein
MNSHVKQMGCVLVALGVGFSIAAFLFFPSSQQESFYMTSLILFAMSAYCFLSLS